MPRDDFCSNLIVIHSPRLYHNYPFRANFGAEPALYKKSALSKNSLLCPKITNDYKEEGADCGPLHGFAVVDVLNYYYRFGFGHYPWCLRANVTKGVPVTLLRDEFLAHYHLRSNVESTFSMIKAKFGERLRSKTETAQTNEMLLKVLCHNICCVIRSMHELGLEPTFWANDDPALKLF